MGPLRTVALNLELRFYLLGFRLHHIFRLNSLGNMPVESVCKEVDRTDPWVKKILWKVQLNITTFQQFHVFRWYRQTSCLYIFTVIIACYGML